MGGSVAAASVGSARGRGLQVFLTEDAVGEGGFTDARGAEQGDGHAVAEEGLKGPAPPGERASVQTTGTAAARDWTSRAAERGVGVEVGFIEDDDGGGAGLVGEGQVALDTAEIEIPVEPGDQEHDVDVGGDQLLGFAIAGRHGGEGGCSCEGAPRERWRRRLRRRVRPPNRRQRGVPRRSRPRRAALRRARRCTRPGGGQQLIFVTNGTGNAPGTDMPAACGAKAETSSGVAPRDSREWLGMDCSQSIHQGAGTQILRVPGKRRID